MGSVQDVVGSRPRGDDRSLSTRHAIEKRVGMKSCQMSMYDKVLQLININHA